MEVVEQRIDASIVSSIASSFISFFIVVVIRNSQFVGVIPAVAPILAPSLKGLIVRAGHHSLKRIALASWSSSSSHSGSSRGLMIDDYRINESIESIEVGRSVFARSVLPLVRSHSCRSRSRSKSMGLINSNKVVIRE